MKSEINREGDDMASFSERLRDAMNEIGYKQTDLANAAGLDKSLISNYLSGKYKARQENLYRLAKALNVSESWLMGYDVPKQRRGSFEEDNIYTFPNIFPIDTVRIPFLGEVSCGEPVYASEEHESYILAGTNVHADFCLRAHGDSMVNARILDGDIVFVKRCDMVDNGEIAVVIIGDETTLKRVYYHREKNLLILHPENPAYQDQIYADEELNTVRILGKAVSFQSDVR